MTAKCTCRIVESYRHAFPRDTARGVPVIQHCPLCASAPELLEALTLIMDGFEKGIFVRDMSRDHEASWAVRLIPFMAALGKAQAAIAHAEASHE